ncbi:MAG: SOUL family heme-binding protein [Actinomycetota bacterium]
MTEQQEYRVLEAHGDVELREYAPCVVADVVVPGSAEQAANAAFRPLFQYISGANRGAEPLAMTAPVIQQSASERLAMTAPVIQEPSDADEWTVSFVLPAGRSLSDYPVPADTRVSLRAVPAETAAAIRWSGRWTESNIARRSQELRREMAKAGWQESGEPRWARFDPPWKPPFARRNEIVIPVRRSDAGPNG